MISTVDDFCFSDVYRCWDGSIKVKCPVSFFGQNEMQLKGHLDSKSSLPIEAYNTLCYLKENFDDVYENILKGLFELQSKGLKYERFNEDDLSFSPITFNRMEEIHPYLGPPVFEILPNYLKDSYAYFAVSFFKDCLLSIEHGLNAIVHKSEMIDIQPTDSYSMLERLKTYEKDCSKWQKNFGLVILEQAKSKFLHDRELVRAKWLKTSHSF